MAQFNGRAKLEEAPVTKDKKGEKSKTPRVRVFYSNGKKELDYLLVPKDSMYSHSSSTCSSAKLLTFA